jgi:hypothetical protein
MLHYVISCDMHSTLPVSRPRVMHLPNSKNTKGRCTVLYYTVLNCYSYLSQIIRNNEVMRRAAEKEHTILSLIRQADLEGKRNCVQLIGTYCVSCHYSSSNFPHCFHWINTKQQTEIQKTHECVTVIHSIYF